MFFFFRDSLFINMWKLLVICIAISAMSAEGAKRYRKRYVGASAGGYAGTGAYAGTGGFAGTYDDDGYVGTGFGYAPDFGPGFIDPYLFHQQLTAQILAQHAAQHNALASTYSTGDASVYADASSSNNPDNTLIQQQIAHQALYNSHRRPSVYNRIGGIGHKSNHYAPNFAYASGSVGPGGYHQSAYISPENPDSPNIVNRFSSSSSPGGYKGVAVSSFSASSDVNGKRTSHRGSQTTVNDNGKITTYSVHS